MIRKVFVQIAVPSLIVFMALNAYLAIHHLRGVQRSVALTEQNLTIQANIAGVLQDLTDMETGQRGYVLTGDNAYLPPYTEAKGRIGNRFASLRSEFASGAEQQRALEAQLEAVATSKQAEMERTITMRQQGYRHRAFVLVNTNEGKEYMEKARALLSSISSMESSRSASVVKERNAGLTRDLSETITSNLVLLALTICVFWLIRHHQRSLEREAVQSARTLAASESRLENLISVLRNQTRSKIETIQNNARLLLEKYGDFLPWQGCEFAVQIGEAASGLESLRRDLVGEPVINVEEKAA